MHLSVIVQQGQHRRAPSAPALPVAKFIFVRKSTKNPPISTASCSFFSSASPACLIAARCIGHRTALQHPSHRAASSTAPHSSKYRTSPRRLPHPAVHPLSSPRRTLPSALITFSPPPPHSPQRPSAFSPAPLRTCPMAFPENSKPALPPFLIAHAIYI